MQISLLTSKFAHRALGLVISGSLLSGCGEETTKPLVQADNQWYQDGQQLLEQKQKQLPNTNRAKNIILFVADGHGITSNTALRIYAGQKLGNPGEEHVLSYEHFPHLALSKTYNTNAQTPDSAGTASAMLTGIKTRAGVLAINESVERGDCLNVPGNEATTALEIAESLGMATGIVTTARITHATPAAGYAHSADRNFENGNTLTPEQKQGGCRDIARQLVEFDHGDGIEVVMGGGRANFLPDTVKDAEGRLGSRQDGANLLKEWQAKHPRGRLLQTQADFDTMDLNDDSPVLGLFSPSHMAYELYRERDKGGEPSLAEMTEAAIELLQQQPKGFFLLVESGRIDHAHHAGIARRALEDGTAYAAAVAKAMEMTDESDTLIIATADHSHTLSMAGYSDRGNPILGLSGGVNHEGHWHPNLAQDYKPYTTLGYANGPGAATQREYLNDESVQHPDFKQPALTPLESETHGGEDVAIYARGPGAWLFSGTVEQNYIFHVINHAAQWPTQR